MPLINGKHLKGVYADVPCFVKFLGPRQSETYLKVVGYAHFCLIVYDSMCMSQIWHASRVMATASYQSSSATLVQALSLQGRVAHKIVYQSTPALYWMYRMYICRHVAMLYMRMHFCVCHELHS